MVSFRKNLISIFIVLLFFIGIMIVEANNSRIPMNSQIQLSGSNLAVGDVNVSITDLCTGGTTLYTETFNRSVNNGLMQFIVGLQNTSVRLTAGNEYCMDMFVNGTDLNYTVNGTTQNRMPFIAPISAYAGLNVSNTTITGADADDTLNITSGGSWFNGSVVVNNRATPAFSVNRGFNISGAGTDVRTNGTMTILNANQDDALNISGGGFYVGDDIDYMRFSLSPSDPMFTIKRIINISAAGDLRIGSGSDGRITILSTDADDALNVSRGGAYINGSLTVSGSVSAGGGLASASDIEWVRITKRTFNNEPFINITSLTNVGNISRIYKVVGYLNHTGTLSLTVNNITNTVWVSDQISGTSLSSTGSQTNCPLSNAVIDGFAYFSYTVGLGDSEVYVTPNTPYPREAAADSIPFACFTTYSTTSVLENITIAGTGMTGNISVYKFND